MFLHFFDCHKVNNIGSQRSENDCFVTIYGQDDKQLFHEDIYDDGNSLAVNTSRSTSSVLSGGDLDDLDFGTSPPTTPMELSNMQPVGQRQKSAPSMINTSTNANFVGSRSSSLNSGKNNSPRSSLVDELIGGNGFKL